MRRRTLALIIFGTVAGLAGLSGCSVSEPQREMRQVKERHLIFNPDFTLAADVPFRRADWPVTVAHQYPRERIEYRETIIDRQITSGRTDDHVYRRFDSIRVGRAHR